MADQLRTYTKKELGGYLVGMFGQNMIYNIIATGLVSTYLQFYLKIPVYYIGIIIAVARVWDAINDPMMGTIVDKTRTKWGKCRPYLIIFPAIIGVITIACFMNGVYTEAQSDFGRNLIVIWAAVSYILWGMLFTVCDIPLWGITSLMTEVEEDRSKILGLARLVAGVGGIGVLVVQIGQVLGTVFTNGLDPVTQAAEIDAGNRKGFIVAVVVLTVLSTICFEFAGISTREKVTVTEEKHTIKENFKLMWQCKPFRQILISGILRSPIQLLMLIAMPFVTYYFANGNIMNFLGEDGINFGMLINIAIVAVGIFVGQFAAMALTPALTKKFENKTLYNLYSIAGAVPFALLFVVFKLAKGDVTSSLIWMILIGLCFFVASAGMGGINVMQSIMIADCVDYEEYHNGIRPDGVFFSGQSFITKLSGGIAALIQSVVYGAVAFSDEAITDMEAALRTGTSFITYNDGKFATAMFFLISVPPAIGMLLSALPTRKFALSDAEHNRILEELVERRNATVSDDIDALAENVDSVREESAAEILEENMDTIVDQINDL